MLFNEGGLTDSYAMTPRSKLRTSKIITIVGARPQFIKAAIVSRALGQEERVSEVIVHTGQHYDKNMSAIFFEQMGIPNPHYNLGVGGGSHGAMTGRQLEKLEEVLMLEKPDLVLVYGDTNSTLAGALAAVKLHIPIAHIEAGLRSFNRRMPEEINRILTDQMSTVLFAPTETARINLLADGIAEDKIHNVGDVMYDATRFYSRRAIKPLWFDDLKVGVGEYVLCTIHRAENTDCSSRLRPIFDGLAAAGLPVILPLHPRTRGLITALSIKVEPHINVTEPVGYLEMVWLEANCRLVATDSGGVQKEAYFHKKMCITLRDETEWVETVAVGCNILVGADSQKIAEALGRRGTPVSYPEIFGSGSSADKIVDVLVQAMES